MKNKKPYFMPSADMVLGDRYRLHECLGDGSYGWVWRSTNLKTDRIVAVKVPKQIARSDNELLEGKILVDKPPHPNVVQIYWMGRVPPTKEWFVIEMEYFPSITLARMLDEGDQGLVLKYDNVLDLFTQVLEGVKYLHAFGVAHGDIKPQNILVSGTHVKITDFGSSVNPDDIYARTRENGGTILYSAPEVAGVSVKFKDNSVYYKADIYSLGVLLYHMVTSRLPHDTYSQVTRHVPFPLPSEVNQTVSPQLEQVIMKCLEVDPANRWSDVEEMVSAYRSARLAQRAFGEVQRLVPFTSKNTDWSTDAVHFLESEEYGSAAEVAKREFAKTKDEQAYLLMLKSYMKEGRTFDCIEALGHRHDLYDAEGPGAVEIRRLALTAFLKAQYISDAHRLVTKCLEDDPDSPDLQLKQAAILGMEAQYAPAVEILLRLNRKYPGTPGILKRLAMVYEQLRDPGKAKAFKRAWEKTSGNASS
ncbi:MAG: protein kinase [Sumerlaeia bacterium]